jgi:hypothetical protein
MLCERCEARFAAVERPRAEAALSRGWSHQRLAQLLCAACGAILAAEGFAERLLRKQGQLARFGLVSAAGPLLETTKREVE